MLTGRKKTPSLCSVKKIIVTLLVCPLRARRSAHSVETQTSTSYIATRTEIWPCPSPDAPPSTGDSGAWSSVPVPISSARLAFPI